MQGWWHRAGTSGEGVRRARQAAQGRDQGKGAERADSAVQQPRGGQPKGLGKAGRCEGLAVLLRACLQGRGLNAHVPVNCSKAPCLFRQLHQTLLRNCEGAAMACVATADRVVVSCRGTHVHAQPNCVHLCVPVPGPCARTSTGATIKGSPNICSSSWHSAYISAEGASEPWAARARSLRNACRRGADAGRQSVSSR